MDISLIIPVYHAAPVLEKTVKRLHSRLGPLDLEYEILFGDDGSTDESPAILKRLAEKDPRVRCLTNPVNRGLGFTLRRLFDEARGEKVVYLDCDLPFGEDILENMLVHLERYDIVVASRYLGKADRVSFPRRMMSFLYYGLCRLLFGVPVRDIGSGTVAMRREVLERLALFSDGFAIHAELYVKARRGGFAVKELPAPSRENDQQSFRIFKHGPATVAGTLKLWFNLR